MGNEIHKGCPGDSNVKLNVHDALCSALGVMALAGAVQ